MTTHGGRDCNDEERLNRCLMVSVRETSKKG